MSNRYNPNVDETLFGNGPNGTGRNVKRYFFLLFQLLIVTVVCTKVRNCIANGFINLYFYERITKDQGMAMFYDY